jgi:hypothetical protein
LQNFYCRIITSLPADDMVWFVFQVLRSSETEFSKNERKEILEKMTQIFSFELEPFSVLLNNISIDYFGKKIKEEQIIYFILKSSSDIKDEYWYRTTFARHLVVWC